MVLNIEQELLTAQAPQAKIIVSLSGEIISYKDYINTVVLGGL